MRIKIWQGLIPFVCVMSIASFSYAAKIQMAILLDGSGSMQGLIDQSKFQLSRIINELENAKKDGQTPTLELALFEHGKGNLSADQGFLQKLSDLVTDIDIVNQKLFQIIADGSEEYTGLAIVRAVNDLVWSDDPQDFKVIFIAGNEAMQQGPVKYQDAIELATSRGILVNTIYAGGADDFDSAEWKEAARLSGGSFANIDSSMTIERIPTVFDDAVLKLNEELNKTYIIYGDRGLEGFGRMLDIDGNMGEHLVERALTKAGHYYDSSDWDLVDAWEKKKVIIDNSFDRSFCIDEMKSMSVEEMIAFLQNKLEDRKLLQKGIQALSALRNEKITSILVRSNNSQLANVHKAIMQALTRQLEIRGFRL